MPSQLELDGDWAAAVALYEDNVLVEYGLSLTGLALAYRHRNGM